MTNEYEITNGAGTWDFLKSSLEDQFPFNYYTTKTVTVNPNFGKPQAWGQWGDGWWNKIGFHNPGIQFYASDYLPLITVPYVLSFYADDHKGAKEIAAALRMYKQKPLWVEWNISCPNFKTDDSPSEHGVSYEIKRMKEAFEGWPLAIKVAPTADPRIVARYAAEGADRIVMCNSLETPRGGLSGPPIHTLVSELIRKVRTEQQCTVPITALGGVQGAQDLERIKVYLEAGADTIGIGSYNLR